MAKGGKGNRKIRPLNNKAREEAKELLEVAIRDFEVSKILMKKGYYPQGIFCLQQAIEKSSKAIIRALDMIDINDLKEIVGHKVVDSFPKIVFKIHGLLEENFKEVKATNESLSKNIENFLNTTMDISNIIINKEGIDINIKELLNDFKDLLNLLISFMYKFASIYDDIYIDIDNKDNNIDSNKNSNKRKIDNIIQSFKNKIKDINKRNIDNYESIDLCELINEIKNDGNIINIQERISNKYKELMNDPDTKKLAEKLKKILNYPIINKDIPKEIILDINNISDSVISDTFDIEKILEYYVELAKFINTKNNFISEDIKESLLSSYKITLKFAEFVELIAILFIFYEYLEVGSNDDGLINFLRYPTIDKNGKIRTPLEINENHDLARLSVKIIECLDKLDVFNKVKYLIEPLENTNKFS